MNDTNFRELKHVGSNFATIPQNIYIGVKWRDNLKEIGFVYFCKHVFHALDKYVQ